MRAGVTDPWARAVAASPDELTRPHTHPATRWPARLHLSAPRAASLSLMTGFIPALLMPVLLVVGLACLVLH